MNTSCQILFSNSHCELYAMEMSIGVWQIAQDVVEGSQSDTATAVK